MLDKNVPHGGRKRSAARERGVGVMNRMARLVFLCLGFLLLPGPAMVLAGEQAPAPVETIHGYPVLDPYRWLEDPAQAEAWINRQNKLTEDYFARVTPAGLAARIEELYQIGYAADPALGGGRVFYLKKEQDAEQPHLYMDDGGKVTLLLDLSRLDAGGKTALDWYYPSRTGRYVAYGLSKGGDENSVLHLLDTRSGKTLAETIPHTRHCSLAWLSDDSGFYYTYYPGGDRYQRHVYFHPLGGDPAADRTVYGKDLPKDYWTTVSLTDDDRYLMINVETGTATTDCFLLDRRTGKLISISINSGSEVRLTDVRDGKCWAVTTLGTPNRRLVEIDPADPAPTGWLDVFHEREFPLLDYRAVGDRLVALYLENAVSRLRVYNLDGDMIGEISLPAPGEVGALAGEPGGGRLVIQFASFLYPPSLFTIEPQKSLEAKPLVMTPTGGRIDPADFEVRYVEYPSFDGAWVPMFIVHRRGLTPNGKRPTLLYGYGGFNINMTPRFSRPNLFWIERGGVFALACIRGGGEKGETWHQAGMFAQKFQGFADFEYAMRYLIRAGYTQPDKLAIRGGSNGGLLVGAMITARPHLFKCAVGSVGLYDMVRYHQFPPAELWVSEYGRSDNPEETGFLWAYSPYHQVLSGVRYPACLIDTAESDTRVYWAHSAKFVAALQDANRHGGPILFYLRREAGHGQGMNWSDMIKETIQMYAFIFDQVGDPAAGE